MSFAQGTNVPISRSKTEIESILDRYGATQFGYGIEPGRAVIFFSAHHRQIRFELSVPSLEEMRITPKGQQRSEATAKKAVESEHRRRWRALALAIKAKFEVVESGISSFENEFLAHVVTPDGKVFGVHAQKALDAAYASGDMPKLLPPPSGLS